MVFIVKCDMLIIVVIVIVVVYEINLIFGIKFSEEELKDVVKVVNDFVNLFNNSFQFSIDKDSDMMVVKVIDISMKEVIK